MRLGDSRARIARSGVAGDRIEIAGLVLDDRERAAVLPAGERAVLGGARRGTRRGGSTRSRRLRRRASPRGSGRREVVARSVPVAADVKASESSSASQRSGPARNIGRPRLPGGDRHRNEVDPNLDADDEILGGGADDDHFAFACHLLCESGLSGRPRPGCRLLHHGGAGRLDEVRRQELQGSPDPASAGRGTGSTLPSFAAVSVSTGTACTSSDGTMLRINLVSSRATVAFNDYFVLPLPDLTNGTLAEIMPQFDNDTLEPHRHQPRSARPPITPSRNISRPCRTGWRGANGLDGPVLLGVSRGLRHGRRERDPGLARLGRSALFGFVVVAAVQLRPGRARPSLRRSTALRDGSGPLGDRARPPSLSLAIMAPLLAIKPLTRPDAAEALHTHGVFGLVRHPGYLANTSGVWDGRSSSAPRSACCSRRLGRRCSGCTLIGGGASARIRSAYREYMARVRSRIIRVFRTSPLQPGDRGRGSDRGRALERPRRGRTVARRAQLPVVDGRAARAHPAAAGHSRGSPRRGSSRARSYRRSASSLAVSSTSSVLPQSRAVGFGGAQQRRA